MSWWVYLEEPNGEPVEVAHHAEGGTYVMGGITVAELNVTYNYGGQFREALPELEGSGILKVMLHGKTGADTIPLLERVVEHCGTDQSDDYWEPTPGNAGHAAAIMLEWARQHPDGRWEVH